MHVVHVITSLVVGGAERLLVDVARAQHAAGQTVSVVELGDPGPLREELTNEGIAVYSVSLAGLTDVPVASHRLWRVLRRLRPGAVHTWMYHANVLGGAVARLARIHRIVWSLHGTRDPTHRGFSFRVRLSAGVSPWVSRAVADAVVCTSEAARVEAVSAGYDRHQLVFVPNAVPLRAVDGEGGRAVRAELGIAEDAPLVIHIGRYDPQKDHATFLEAFRHLAARLEDVHAVMCGRGVTWDQPQLEAAARASGASERIHLLGPRDDVTRLQAAADVLVSSSAFGESAPLAVLEAMAQRTPVVTTDVGDCAEIVGDTGLVAAPRDPPGIAEAVVELLREAPEQRRRRGDHARHRVVTRYDFDRLLDDYASLYDGRALGQSATSGWRRD